MRLVVENIAKSFAEKEIFKDINFEVESGNSVAIVGPNGSGKSNIFDAIAFALNLKQSQRKTNDPRKYVHRPKSLESNVKEDVSG